MPILALPIAVARVVHPDVLPRRHVEHHVARWHRAGDWRAGGCVDRDGGERLPARVGAGRRRTVGRTTISRAVVDRARRKQVGRADLLLPGDHHRVVRAGVPARGAGRADVPAARVHQDVCDGGRLAAVDHARAGADDRRSSAGGGCDRSRRIPSRGSSRGCTSRSCGWRCAGSGRRSLVNVRRRAADDSAPVRHRQRVHAAALRRLDALHADGAARACRSPRRRGCCRCRTSCCESFRRWSGCSARWAAAPRRRTTRRWGWSTRPSC